MTEHFKPGLSYAIVLLDVLVYSIYIPYFPVILGNYVSDSQWLRMQSLANLVAVVFAVVTGAVYDRFGGFAGLVLSQMCCLVTSLMLWYGSIALSIKSNNRGSEMVMEIDWVYICYLFTRTASFIRCRYVWHRICTGASSGWSTFGCFHCKWNV